MINDSSIAFFSCSSQESQDFFSERFPDSKRYPHDIQDYQPENLGNRSSIEIVSSFTGSRWDQEHIDWFPNLKHIVNRSTGYDNVDLEYCREKNIAVYNVPDYGSATVAEHAFALILEFSRKVSYSNQLVRHDKNFKSRGLPATRGFDLSGKTIGIIGAGKIGQHSISIAHGFGMNIMVSDPHYNASLAEQYNITWAQSLADLVSQSDIISIHAPYCHHTHHLINADIADHIKPGCILINTARGELVDTVTLVSLLDQGVVAYAGLDVLEEEGSFGKNDSPIQSLNQRLLQMENVIITPHNGFNTTEAITRIWQGSAHNISSIQKNHAHDAHVIS